MFVNKRRKEKWYITPFEKKENKVFQCSTPLRKGSLLLRRADPYSVGNNNKASYIVQRLIVGGDGPKLSSVPPMWSSGWADGDRHECFGPATPGLGKTGSISKVEREYQTHRSEVDRVNR